jgi:WD40 repeat protein
MDYSIKIWETATGRQVRKLEGHVPYEERREIITPSGKREFSSTESAFGVTSVAFSPNGRLLASAGGDDMTVRVWDVATGRELRVFRGHAQSVHSIGFSPDGKRLVSASADSTVRVWDADTGQELLTLRSPTDTVLTVAFSPEGDRLVAGCADGIVKVWDGTPLR